MADAFVDFTNGSDANDGLTWVNAEVTVQAGLTTAGSGGRCFVQIDKDNVNTSNKDTASGARTLTFPGTDQVPFGLYGCKNGTTAEPPTDSDLVVRGTDGLPIYETTGGGNLDLDETTAFAGVHVAIHGMRFDADGDLTIGGDISFRCSDCELDFDVNLSRKSSSQLELFNCQLIHFDSLSFINGDSVGDGIFMYGGILGSGTAPTILIDNFNAADLFFYGVDCSAVTGTLVDVKSSGGRGIARFINCKMGTGFTRISGASRAGWSGVELINSSDETGLGSGESVRDYAKEYYARGTILNEATIIRTGGANDGVAGFSYALKPNTSSTKESMLGLDTPWFGGLVEGDATTSKDFTIHIANDSGSDLTKADVWVELLHPSEAGTTDHGFDISSRTVIDASASNVTDDTASDWSTGAGGKNAQKIVIAKTPDYTGPVYARVIFAQAGTTTCYVDPKVYVTDT